MHPIQHTGFCQVSDDTYSFWEVVQFRAPSHAFVQQFAPSLPSAPSWLALVSTEVGKYLHWVSQWKGAWWWLPLWVAMDTCVQLKACFSLDTTTCFYRHLPQAHLLGMSLILLIVYTINRYIAVPFILEDFCWINFNSSLSHWITS